EAPSERSEAKAKRSRLSRSFRAGLLFPVSRVDRQLRSGNFAKRFGAKTPIYLAAVLQSVTQKAMQVAGNATKKSKQPCISPSDLQTAVKKSSSLKKLLQGTVSKHCDMAVPQNQRKPPRSRKKTGKSE
ncbi:H2A4 protein, partial [Crotophaga sulcirostris]|nr:H2A4 protein [Crotophaga sulcirostris]